MTSRLPQHDVDRLDFRDRLREELARRRAVNRRYSLRAFAEFLAIDHSTLSQILRGRRALSAECLRTWAAALKLGAEEIEIYAAAEQVGDFASFEQGARRILWVAEAATFMARSVHWRLLQLLNSPQWRPDMNWVATQLGVSVDEVNDALWRLLRLGLLRIDADGAWRDATGLNEPTERGIKECALARMRLASARL